jgi:hypothetical protein
MQRFAGVTLIAGTLLFAIYGMMPVTRHVFGTDDDLLSLRYIEENPATWDLALAMFAAGGLTAAIGLVPLARSVRRVTNRRLLGVMAHGAATLAIVGAVSWVIRIVQSPHDVPFADFSPWLLRTYEFFTPAAFIIFGVVLLLSGYPKWLGWLLMVSGAMMIAALVAVSFFVPAVYYVVFLILGVTLLTLRPPPWQQSLGPAPDNESRT